MGAVKKINISDAVIFHLPQHHIKNLRYLIGLHGFTRPAILIPVEFEEEHIPGFFELVEMEMSFLLCWADTR